MKIKGILLGFGLLTMMSCGADKAKSEKKCKKKQPNIVVIYADDLGYGDVSANGVGKLQTPSFDKIANEGIRFTNGYATSATCTPSRFGLLTGQYPWKNSKAAVLPGDAPLLIDTEAETLPKMLKNAGYTTAVVGKWHLGLGAGNLDWNQTICPNANDIGFDYSYIMAATNDRVPTVYVKNGSVVGLEKNDPLHVSYKKNFDGEPTGTKNPELLKMNYSHGHNNSILNGVPRIGFQTGGKSAMWNDQTMAELFLNEAVQFVNNNKEKPFFLFYALHQPHVPRVPNNKFSGKSGMGPRGDAILEADWVVGEFLKELEKAGLDDNTIIVFSSDNGPVLDDGYFDQSDELIGDHTPWGNFRGGKYSMYDAGTHVPFFVRWKGQIEPGVSEALVSQIDLYTSFATLVGQKSARKGSQNMLDALLGKSKKGRTSLLAEGLKDKMLLRKGNWTYLTPHKGSKLVPWGVKLETGFTKEGKPQLFDLSNDEGQKNNLAPAQPERVKEMQAELVKLLNE